MYTSGAITFASPRSSRDQETIFTILRTYCENTTTRWDVLFVTFSKYHSIFATNYHDTFGKLNAFHAKSICYILASLDPDPDFVFADIVVFLYFAHVVEDDYELGTNMTGARPLDVLAVNDVVFPVIMQMTLAKVNAFWARVFPDDIV